MTQENGSTRRLQRTPAASPCPEGSGLAPAGQERAHNARRIIYWSLAAIAAALILSLQPAYANIWETFTNIMKDIYGKLLGVSTIIAVTAATVALLVRMISRNQRAVDEATTWLKRIVVTWLILNTLGFFVAYIQPLVSGGQYTP